jgi:hypothetical protein
VWLKAAQPAKLQLCLGHDAKLKNLKKSKLHILSGFRGEKLLHD